MVIKLVRKIAILGLLTFIAVIITSCTVGHEPDDTVIEQNIFDSLITIEGIAVDEHVEYFTLIISDATETRIYAEELMQIGVVNGKLEIEVERLQTQAEIALEIDNSRIAGEYQIPELKAVNPETPNATFSLEFIALITEVKIVAVEELASLEVPYGTAFNDLDLPDRVEVMLEDESNIKIDVQWDETAYQPEEPGEQVLFGEIVNLPDMVVNPDKLEAEIIVKVGFAPDLEGEFQLYQEYEILYIIELEGHLIVRNPDIRYLKFISDSNVSMTIPRVIDLETSKIVTGNDIREVNFSRDTILLSAYKNANNIIVRGLDQNQQEVAWISVRIER